MWLRVTVVIVIAVGECAIAGRLRWHSSPVEEDPDGAFMEKRMFPIWLLSESGSEPTPSPPHWLNQADCGTGVPWLLGALWELCLLVPDGFLPKHERQIHGR